MINLTVQNAMMAIFCMSMNVWMYVLQLTTVLQQREAANRVDIPVCNAKIYLYACHVKVD